MNELLSKLYDKGLSKNLFMKKEKFFLIFLFDQNLMAPIG